jgi:hypothetical protein
VEVDTRETFDASHLDHLNNTLIMTLDQGAGVNSARTPPASAHVDDVVADDAEPTYTHFAHRVEFAALEARFLAFDVGTAPTQAEDEAEVVLVTQMGAIVSCTSP